MDSHLFLEPHLQSRHTLKVIKPPLLARGDQPAEKTQPNPVLKLSIENMAVVPEFRTFFSSLVFVLLTFKVLLKPTA